MTTLTARMEVVLEEVSMDIRDFIRNMFGQPNDALTRATIQNEISLYFNYHPDIDNGFCQCDDANNPPAEVRLGKLTVAMHFSIDGVLFVGAALVDPTSIASQSVVDVEINFFMQRPRFGMPVVTKDMPEDLARTLGF